MLQAKRPQIDHDKEAPSTRSFVSQCVRLQNHVCGQERSRLTVIRAGMDPEQHVRIYRDDRACTRAYERLSVKLQPLSAPTFAMLSSSSPISSNSTVRKSKEQRKCRNQPRRCSERVDCFLRAAAGDGDGMWWSGKVDVLARNGRVQHCTFVCLLPLYNQP